MELLRGKKALITGATRGIGRAVSISFAENGADLCLVSRKEEEVQAFAREISSNLTTKIFGLRADVSDQIDGSKIGAKAIDLLGGIDVLVCVAGYRFESKIWNSSLQDLSEDDFVNVFNTDVLGSLRLVKGVLPQMVRQKSGVIILFSSTPAISGFNKGAPYTLAKAANRSLAKEIAYEYGEFNVRAYAIAPGNVKTDATFDNLSNEDQIALAQESPMKRWGDPKEIAKVCVVLASDNMSYVTGQTIVADGGTVML